MKKKILILMAAVGIWVSGLSGCGPDTMHELDVGSRLAVMEKKINQLDTDYLVDNVYTETIETDKEAVIAAAFLWDALFQSADAAVQAAGTIAVNALEKADLATKKDFAKLAKEWKEGILEDFEYEITDYKVIDDACTAHEDGVVALVEQRITVGSLAFSGEAYVEFVYQDKKWKFHMISESDVYADNSGDSNDSSDLSDSNDSGIETGSIDRSGIDLTCDLTGIRFLLAADSTVSMKGYSHDNRFVTLIKGLENANNAYDHAFAATVAANEDRYLKWFPYDGKMAVGVTRTDNASYNYYCSGKYESNYAGPVRLLLEDENNVGAFGANTVTTIVTDLHEQGGTLYTIGNDIRRKCIENLGSEDAFAIAIFHFDFYYQGTSWIVNPKDPSQSISASFDGASDERPLYVIMAGQKEGVYDYAATLKAWLKQNGIPYEMVDNLKAVEEPGVQIEWEAGETADAANIKKLIKSGAESREEDLEAYVNTHITRLAECDGDQISKYTTAEVRTEALSYAAYSLEINSSYKGYWNWTGSYTEKRESKTEDLPYTTVCSGIQVYQEKDGSWEELTEKAWKKMFTVTAKDGSLRISCISRDPEVVFKKQNFRFVFHMEQSLKKEVRYPSWISDQDLSLSGALESPDTKVWHQKTMDFDLFCRSLLALTTTETTIDCSISHSDDIEIVLLNVSNK